MRFARNKQRQWKRSETSNIIQQGGATVVYDGDGNRVSKTVAGVTTAYLVSEVNPTGYVQVLTERFSGGSGAQEVLHNYVYGLDRISQSRSYFTGSQSLTEISYYVYDGHGSTRALTDPSGNVTDTYDYDAFGNLTHSATTLSSPTPNEFLFAGEQYDSNLHLYYNRARYLNTSTGRFWSMDAFDGDSQSPLSLHKYLYAQSSPVDALDPSGHDEVAEVEEGALIGITEDAGTTAEELGETILEGPPPEAPPPPTPPPTIPNTPVPVSFGSYIGQAVVTLIALGLVASQASDNEPLPPTQPQPGDEEQLTVYRDADGPSPSDFKPSTTAYSATGWGLSLLQQPQRNKRWIVPFTVAYRKPLLIGTVGVVADPIFVGFMGAPVPIIYSPPEGPGGHWTLQTPAGPAEQTLFQGSLAAYGKSVKLAATPTP